MKSIDTFIQNVKNYVRTVESGLGSLRSTLENEFPNNSSGTCEIPIIINSIENKLTSLETLTKIIEFQNSISPIGREHFNNSQQIDLLEKSIYSLRALIITDFEINSKGRLVRSDRNRLANKSIS